MPGADPLRVRSPWPPRGRTRVQMRLGQCSGPSLSISFSALKLKYLPWSCSLLVSRFDELSDPALSHKPSCAGDPLGHTHLQRVTGALGQDLLPRSFRQSL